MKDERFEGRFVGEGLGAPEAKIVKRIDPSETAIVSYEGRKPGSIDRVMGKIDEILDNAWDFVSSEGIHCRS